MAIFAHSAVVGSEAELAEYAMWDSYLPANTQLWVWGDSVPDPSDMDHTFPNHGVVLLHCGEEAFEIVTIKSPVEWDSASGFCHTVLPAAIRKFFDDVSLDLDEVSEARAQIDPAGADCECLMSAFIDMGFTLFGQGDESEPVNDDAAAALYCASGVQLIVAHFEDDSGVPNLPAATAAGEAALADVVFVISTVEENDDSDPIEDI